MKMRSRRRLAAFLALLLTVAAAGAGWPGRQTLAADEAIEAQAPGFPVTVNGVSVHPGNGVYPLLYKEMTYLPLTPEYSQALGLEVTRGADGGLSIGQGTPQGRRPELDAKEEKTAETGAPGPLKGSRPTYPIRVNGQSIHNDTEPYPLLEFGGVPYMPMTWRFARTELGLLIDWSPQTGFSIVSPQKKVLHKIVFDDEQYYYAETVPSGLVQVDKGLTANPVRTDGQKEAAVRQQAQAAAWGQPFTADPQAAVTVEGDSVRYEGSELLSLKPYKEKADNFFAQRPEYEYQGIDVQGQVMKLGEHLRLAAVSISYLKHIPAPYTPYEHRLFVLRNGTAAEVPGMQQLPTRVLGNADGSWWIVSEVAERLTSSTPNVNGEAVLLKADGTMIDWNGEWGVKDIDVIRAESGGSLIVKAYNDRYKTYYDSYVPLLSEQKEWYGRIHPDGTSEPLAAYDGTGKGYVDQEGRLIVVDRKMNRIADLTDGRSRLWWDYELQELLP